MHLILYLFTIRLFWNTISSEVSRYKIIIKLDNVLYESTIVGKIALPIHQRNHISTWWLPAHNILKYNQILYGKVLKTKRFEPTKTTNSIRSSKIITRSYTKNTFYCNTLKLIGDIDRFFKDNLVLVISRKTVRHCNIVCLRAV